MNKILKISSFAILALSASCGKKFLDKEPLALPVDANFYKTNDDMIMAVNAAYDPLSWESSNNTNNIFFNFLIGDISSDDANAGGNGGETRVLPYAQFNITPADLGLQELWKKYYIGIYRTNLVIEKAPLSNASPDVKNRVTGEALFLRGYYYFKLVTTFGGVPLVTKLLTADEYQMAKSPASDVYAQIEADLTSAAGLLPEKGAIQLGRATRGAANALLARTYLFQNKWRETLTASETVINSRVYGLESDYYKVHSLETENGIESIFEIQASNAISTGDERQNEGTFYNKYVAPRGQLIGGFGVNTPSQELVNAFKEDSAVWGKMDPRMKATIIFHGDSVNGKPITTSVDGTPRTPGIDYYSRKYVVDTIVGQQTNGAANQRIIRFADVLLMAAEASYNLGNETAARMYVDSVRARVDMPRLSSDATTYTGEALKQAIWNERRLELAMEGLRFFDIVRQGRAAQLIRATEEGRNFRPNVNEVFPIPQTEIDLSGGKIIQNNGY